MEETRRSQQVGEEIGRCRQSHREGKGHRREGSEGEAEGAPLRADQAARLGSPVSQERRRPKLNRDSPWT